MSSIGTLFKVTTCGESHGIALMAIVDGVPPNIALCATDIQIDLDRRKPAQNKYTTQRRENDTVQIISGVFEGKTTGAPIGLVVENSDQKSKDYDTIKDSFRPNHADFVYFAKYRHRDYRGGGRASARETVMRVAAGAIAKKVLAQFGVQISAFVCQVGDICAQKPYQNFADIDWVCVQKSMFFCPENLDDKIVDLIDDCRRTGDSVGARVCVMATGMPVGLGAPVFDKLDADIAHALMGINAVKGVEIGDGISVASMRGQNTRDAMHANAPYFSTNHAGGVLGGISTGQDIVAHVAFKPTPSIVAPIESIDRFGRKVQISTKGRHDPCVGIRAVPICEAMLAIVLCDHLLRSRGQIGTVGFLGFDELIDGID